MDIFSLLYVLLGGLIIITLIIPWVNRSDINSLRNEVQQLRNQVNNLLKQLSTKEINSEQAAAQQEPSTTSKSTATQSETIGPQAVTPEISQVVPLSSQAVIQKQSELPIKTKAKIDFEKQFGTQLPVWIGAIALVLSGFFLVKYSIEAGLITEKVRVIIGIIFGCSLIIAAYFIRQKAHLANSVRITQALSGAGIADLYLCIFAATNLYHLFPALVGFIGMAMVTAIAVILSLRHGMPIALLGLIGGLITPALIHSQSPNALLLFLYLYIVLLGLFIIIKKQQWWVLAFPLLIGAFLWVIFWIFFYYVPGDSFWLDLFLVALSATYIISSNKQFDENIKQKTQKFKLPMLLNYLTLGSAAVLMGLVGIKGGFDIQDWSLFGLLAAGSIFIAYFNQKLYGFMPWLLMIVNAVMLLSWNNPELNHFIIIIILFALLYSGSSYCLMWRTSSPLNWAGLCGVTSVLYFLIAYYQLHKTSLFTMMFTSAWIWGPIALVLSVASVVIVWRILGLFNENKQLKQQLLTVFVLTTIAFFSLGLTILLKQNMLAVAFATQVLVISWINTKVEIQSLRPISELLTLIFILILMPQLLIFLSLACNSLIIEGINITSMPVIASSPLFQLGVTAILLAYSSWLFREQQDDRLVKYLEMITVILFSLMGYCLIRGAFHLSNNWFSIVSSFTERGVITNMFFFIAAVSLMLSHQFARPALTICGLVLIIIVTLRITYFDLLFLNPLWSHQFVGNLPLINALVLPFGMTLLWFQLAEQQLQSLSMQKLIKYANQFCLLLLFVWISLSVRQLFQGGYLDSGIASNAEIYSYSVVWLVLGVALLIVGTLKHDKMLRIASLIVIILTVGKVFLYDASALTGLYRVFSFLLLGLILMALSWFYTRFVFVGKGAERN